MILSNLRLLEGLRSIAATIRRETENKDHQSQLTAANRLLNLLILREDTQYAAAVRDAASRGRKLVEDGIALLPRSHAKLAASYNEAAQADQNTDSDLVPALLSRSERMSRALAGLVREIGDLNPNGSDSKLASWTSTALEWDSMFHALGKPSDAEGQVPPQQALSRESFEAYLRDRFPERGKIKVNNFTVLVGGMSRRTILFEMEDAVEGKQRLVIRAEQPVNILFLEDLDITTEFGIIDIAFRSGVAAPEPLWMEPDPKKLGMRFIVVRQLPGTSFGGPYSITKELSEPLLKNLVAGLYQIHKVDVHQFPEQVATTHLRHWMGLSTVAECVDKYVRLWLKFWREIDGVSPIVEYGFKWLLNNIPDAPGKPAFLHSDYGLGNLLLEGDNVTAVLDWEATHLGDPAEELSWLMYNLRQQVGRDKILALYREAGGRIPDEFRLRYFDALHVIKTLICGFAGYTAYGKHRIANPNFYLVGDMCLSPFTDQLAAAVRVAETAKKGFPTKRFGADAIA